MSKILLLMKDEGLVDFYQALINAYYDGELLFAQTAGKALQYVDSNQTNFIIIDLALPEASIVIKNLLKRDQAIACILTGSIEEISEAKRVYKTQTLLDYFPHHDDSDLLLRKIEKIFTLQDRTRSPKKFCKVNLSFFYTTKEVFCDVYIQIAEDKFVKVLNRYDKIDFADLRKYDKKNIKYLYVRERDFTLITKKLVQSLKPLSSSGGGSDLIHNESLSMMFSIQLQETVSETIQKIGLNQEALEMTSIAINNTMGLVQKNNEIYEILQKSIKHENYCSEHSFLLAYVSCAILKETPFDNEEASLALTLAAFFHDVAIEDPEMAKIQSNHELNFKTLGIADQEDFLSHPIWAKSIVEKIEGVPKPVSSIIENHHEKYNGNGFPQGLNYRRLGPLCSIFNVSHEIVLYLFDSGGDQDHIKDILLELEKDYPLGHYATAVRAALVVFNIEQEKLESA